MTLIELVDNLICIEAQIQPCGETIKVIAPSGALTAELKDALRENKPELVRVLTPGLCEYLHILAAYGPAHASDLPPAPAFPDCPERPIAWSAWWDCVERVNRGRR